MKSEAAELSVGFVSDEEPDGLPRGWLRAQRDKLVRHSILPLRREGRVLRMAVSDSDDADLASRVAGTLNSTAEIQLAPKQEIEDGLVGLFREEDAHSATWSHAESLPHQSASRVITTAQKAVGASLISGIAFSLVFKPQETLICAFSILTAIYLISALSKAALVLRALSAPRETIISDEEIQALDDSRLPCYTILLPCYQEANMLRGLISGMEALDYPKEKLDVKLLLEEDDTETSEAADREVLPPYFQKLIVPRGKPRGKPRACNYGLLHARGDYCVIFDAEDHPEPDQLKKAIVAFRKSGQRTICVQAKLNYYNRDQNLLTSWFAAEYLTWFELYLPALHSFASPIPLGGTSNHFRTDALREVGGWDPFNVTEDADIGIRVARKGWVTEVIDSITEEEATSEVGNWIRQRSRWTKGYMQTWLVHMRNPWILLREIGPVGFFSIQIMILGTFVTYFFNPIAWTLVLAWYATHAAGIQSLFPAPLLYPAGIALFAGNLASVYAVVMACLRRGYPEGVKYALLSPFYWALMSIAAWKALHELIVKPHYWQKTRHGVAHASVPEMTPNRRPMGSLEPRAVPEQIHGSDQ